MHILAVDPGKTTGFAVWTPTQGKPYVSSNDNYLDFCAYVANLLPKCRGRVQIVTEKWIITPETHKLTPQPYSAEINGTLKYLAYSRGAPPVVQQTAANAKTFCTDATLKKLDWWSTSDHERDAMRHLYLYIVTNKLMDPVLLD